MVEVMFAKGFCVDIVAKLYNCHSENCVNSPTNATTYMHLWVFRDVVVGAEHVESGGDGGCWRMMASSGNSAEVRPSSSDDDDVVDDRNDVWPSSSSSSWLAVGLDGDCWNSVLNRDSPPSAAMMDWML